MSYLLSLLFVAFITLGACPKPVMINQSDEVWKDIDYENFEKAKVRCKEKFENSPCLKKFIKRQPLTYWVICGGEN